MNDKIAYIREAECIGCTKCIPACSDQAILGARKLMHTIITDLCTGCEDCIAVCPVDCIEMITKPASFAPTLTMAHKASLTQTLIQAAPSLQAKKDLIAAAMERTKAKRAALQGKLHDSTEMPRHI